MSHSVTFASHLPLNGGEFAGEWDIIPQMRRKTASAQRKRPYFGLGRPK
jgi:hypothetical protein